MKEDKQLVFPVPEKMMAAIVSVFNQMPAGQPLSPDYSVRTLLNELEQIQFRLLKETQSEHTGSFG